jgi:hypothetical protein
MVITCPSIQLIANRVAEAVLAVVPNTSLSLNELSGVRSLIFQAISDKRFFDWEMPTLTGFNADEFARDSRPGLNACLAALCCHARAGG